VANDHDIRFLEIENRFVACVAEGDVEEFLALTTTQKDGNELSA